MRHDGLTDDFSFNPKLRDYGRPIGFDMFHADIKDVLRMPLVHHPGENWEYGIGIDWAGIVLQRATGTGLNDWIQKNIMEPLGLKNINMLPTPEMKKNLAYMHQRWPGSSGSEERDHIYREPIIAESDEDKKKIFHSGGAGAFAKPTEYVQVLAMLLNDGKSPTTGAQVLKPETVNAMFENQVRLPRRTVTWSSHTHATGELIFTAINRSPTSQISRVREFRRQRRTRRIQRPSCIRRRATHRRAGDSVS